MGVSALGGGVSLLVLLTLSMQIVLGGEGLLVTTSGNGSDATRVCLRRMPTEVVRVIRDLVERRSPAGELERPTLERLAAETLGASPCGLCVGSTGGMGEWLLDLPPPARGC